MFLIDYNGWNAITKERNDTGAGSEVQEILMKCVLEVLCRLQIIYSLWIGYICSIVTRSEQQQFNLSIFSCEIGWGESRWLPNATHLTS